LNQLKKYFSAGFMIAYQAIRWPAENVFEETEKESEKRNREIRKAANEKNKNELVK
jgi:hypothetical protein